MPPVQVPDDFDPTGYGYDYEQKLKAQQESLAGVNNITNSHHLA